MPAFLATRASRQKFFVLESFMSTLLIADLLRLNYSYIVCEIVVFECYAKRFSADLVGCVNTKWLGIS